MGDIFSFQKIIGFFTPERLTLLLRISITLIGGLIFFRFLAFILGRITRKRLTAQASMIIRKFTFYIGAVVIVLIVLRQAGLSLAALLGTAGVVGIAIGFASQKSISNLISGLFLISEKPFLINDVIKIGSYTGVVTSVDLLSVKIRTFNNQYVRIPNEQILNTELVNITRYPIRRFDIKVAVAYKEDLQKVRELLYKIADSCKVCLDEPEPLFIIEDFGESGINILFGVWFEKSDFLQLRNEMMTQIKNRFAETGIEIPFPHRTIYSGSVTDPFPVVLKQRGGRKP